MITSFYMPTRIVSGSGALAHPSARSPGDLTMSRVGRLDPVISGRVFHADALAVLAEAASPFSRFDECGIDARGSTSTIRAERGGAIASTGGVHRRRIR